MMLYITPMINGNFIVRMEGLSDTNMEKISDATVCVEKGNTLKPVIFFVVQIFFLLKRVLWIRQYLYSNFGQRNAFSG